MAAKSWTITRWSDRTYVDNLTVTPKDVGGPANGYSIQKHTLRGGLSDGVDVIHIDNGTLRFAVLPTRGMGIWRAWIGDAPIGWHSPIRGPVHPAFVPLADPGGLGWLDGFDEWLVRCGLESNGAPEFNEQGNLRYGLHGRIANKPAHEVELAVNGDTGEITLRGIVDEIRFHFFKLRMFTTIKTTVGQAALTVSDTIQNLSASPTDIQMLYHINYGAPWLDPSAQLIAPIKAVAPRDRHAAENIGNWTRYAEPVAGMAEQVYFLQLQADQQQNTQVLLKNADQTRGVGVHLNVKQLPCFSVWKNTTAEADGYVTGLEPGTNYPNPRSFETAQGRTVPLAGGATCSFDLRLAAYRDKEEVLQAEQAVVALEVDPPQVFDQPQPSWSADA